MLRSRPKWISSQSMCRAASFSIGESRAFTFGDRLVTFAACNSTCLALERIVNVRIIGIRREADNVERADNMAVLLMRIESYRI